MKAYLITRNNNVRPRFINQDRIRTRVAVDETLRTKNTQCQLVQNIISSSDVSKYVM